MGGYISVLYKNYNIPVDNENQYADLFTFRRKGLYIYIVATSKMIKALVKGYAIWDSFMIENM